MLTSRKTTTDYTHRKIEVRYEREKLREVWGESVVEGKPREQVTERGKGFARTTESGQ
jgi:hypothetical protein